MAMSVYEGIYAIGIGYDCLRAPLLMNALVAQVSYYYDILSSCCPCCIHCRLYCCIEG